MVLGTRMGIAPNLSAPLVDPHGDDMVELTRPQRALLNSKGHWNTIPDIGFI